MDDSIGAVRVFSFLTFFWERISGGKKTKGEGARFKAVERGAGVRHGRSYPRRVVMQFTIQVILTHLLTREKSLEQSPL
jgi:hypothetical protein